MFHLQVGDSAPNFEVINEKNQIVRLSDYRGKKLVLYFYPKDDTPSCTAEACSLRDSYAAFQHRGYEILGISTDPVKKHQKFREKYSLPFSLLSDENNAVAELYGVWGEKKLFGHTYMGIHRTTFMIDEEGIIERIIQKVESSNHADQLLVLSPENDR